MLTNLDLKIKIFTIKKIKTGMKRKKMVNGKFYVRCILTQLKKWHKKT